MGHGKPGAVVEHRHFVCSADRDGKAVCGGGILRVGGSVNDERDAGEPEILWVHGDPPGVVVYQGNARLRRARLVPWFPDLVPCGVLRSISLHDYPNAGAQYSILAESILTP